MATGSSDPVAIQQEIEQTRRELAETVDAIAQRVSPKNVANRSTERLKATAREQGAVLRVKGEELRGKATELAGKASGVASSRVGDRLPAVLNPGASASEPIGDSAVTPPGGNAYDEIAAWDTSRQTVRWDRVAAAGGALTVLFVILRRRKSRHH